MKHPVLRNLLVGLLLATFSLQGTQVLAGTTGALSGTLVEVDAHNPIANAKVTATSPSETVTTTTDGGGHFAFVSLAPDSYTVSAERPGYESASITGVNVFADPDADALPNHP
jgi:hypothetical protein